MNATDFQKKLKHYRISAQEHERITKSLGRPMKDIEWALYSALWSEHCSYKSSKVHLKKFAQTLTSRVVTASGENAGIVDLGDGERIAFKMESHNHPSFIEPYQGAATGVGGILRDIFTMGARPIALADYLCFGEPSSGRMKTLVDGVVRGIAGYGNCVGVPTVTGQTQFDPSYNGNILVNAMAVGLLRKNEPVALSVAKGAGHLVVYVGAKTGKDGVHGAAMASESFDENSEAKKPNVQIGDPYFEKLLIESCLEVIQQNMVVAIQDMGAAGLTSSSFEMSAKSGHGFRLNLDQVPLRDSSMTAEDILLSESQERMLLLCEIAKLPALQAKFERWGLEAVVIGEVLATPEMEIYWHGECLTKIKASQIVDDAPMYERPYHAWKPHSKVSSKEKLESVSDGKILKQDLMSEVGGVHGSSRSAIYRQYDQRVGLRTVRGADHDVAVLRLPDSGKALAISVGCRAQVMQMDAAVGGIDAVIYPALQMAIKGFESIAVTDCLNFGNPEKPEIMSEFVAAVEGIAAASKAFNSSVISGNVSFYNETLGKNITSTPATGLVGLKSDIENLPEDQFQKTGSQVYLVGEAQVFAESFLRRKADKPNLFCGDLDIESLAKMAKSCRELVNSQKILSTQMVGRGGLLKSLLRMSSPEMGFDLTAKLSLAELGYERFYSAIFEVAKAKAAEFEAKAKALGLKVSLLGQTLSSDKLRFSDNMEMKLSEVYQSYEQGLRRSVETLV